LGTGANVEVYNLVAQALLDRLVRAVRENKKFKVIIMIPQLPDGALNFIPTRTVLFLDFETLARGPNSLVKQFSGRFPNVRVSDYLVVLSARSTSYNANPFFDGVERSGGVYIHSKMIIVDDRYISVGSANFNDRSFLGTRDSEANIYCQRDDGNSLNPRVVSVMDGQSYEAYGVALAARLRSWNEFFGFPLTDTLSLRDVLDDAIFQDVVYNRSKTNQDLFAAVFDNIPSNSKLTIDSMESASAVPRNVPLLSGLRGLAVLYPLDWLSSEDLWPTFVFNLCLKNSDLYKTCTQASA
jgi:phospholipase D1/2